MAKIEELTVYLGVGKVREKKVEPSIISFLAYFWEQMRAAIRMRFSFQRPVSCWCCWSNTKEQHVLMLDRLGPLTFSRLSHILGSGGWPMIWSCFSHNSGQATNLSRRILIRNSCPSWRTSYVVNVVSYMNLMVTLGQPQLSVNLDLRCRVAIKAKWIKKTTTFNFVWTFLLFVSAINFCHWPKKFANFQGHLLMHVTERGAPHPTRGPDLKKDPWWRQSDSWHCSHSSTRAVHFVYLLLLWLV